MPCRNSILATPRDSCHPRALLLVLQYGHTMMWWDWLAGTYKMPEDVRQFNKSHKMQVLGGSDYDPAEPVPDNATKEQ
jgi:hypothetical protein